MIHRRSIAAFLLAVAGALLAACGTDPVLVLPTLVPTATTASIVITNPPVPTPRPPTATSVLSEAEGPAPSPSPSPTLMPTANLDPPTTSTPTPEPVTTVPPDTAIPTPSSAAIPTGWPTSSPLILVTPTLSDTTAVPTPVPIVPMAPDVINVVVLGSDRRPDWDDWHTDVVQIVSIQTQLPAVTILSIPRDLYVYIPGFRMSRINFADLYGEVYHYEGSGLALMRQTLLYNLGISVHYYARTDFEGLVGIVDALGGIDVPVHCYLSDYWPIPNEQGEYDVLTLYPGMHHMDGEMALWYSRSRMTTSVFSRERRQQQVLEAIWRKVRSLELLPRIPQLWSLVESMVVTDIDLRETLVLAEVAFRLESENIRFRNIGRSAVTPWTTPTGGSVFLPNWDTIGPIVAEALAPVPENRLARTYSPVEVWNGTHYADWDWLSVDVLNRAGFPAVVGEPDRRGYPETLIVDFNETPKGSGLTTLQAMFHVPSSNVISQPAPSSPYRFRIILGADHDPCESW